MFLDLGLIEKYLIKTAAEEGVFNAEKQFDKIKISAIDGIKTVFPIEGEKHTLVLKDAWVNDNIPADDYLKQKEAKLKDGTYGVPLYGKVDLIDNETGMKIDSIDRVKLMDLPKLTTRQTFIVKGSEWNLPLQFRLKPGAYTVMQDNGLPKTQINLAEGSRGKKLEIHMDPTKGSVQLKVANSHVPLYPVLRRMGISHNKIAKKWGQEVAEVNRDMYEEKSADAIKKLANKYLDTQPENVAEAEEQLREHLSTTKIDRETTQATLRKPYAKLDENLLLDAASRLIEVQQGKADPDDRDHLQFKTVHTVEDFFKERLEKNKRLVHFRLKRAIDSKDKVRDILAVPHIKKVSEGLFTQMTLSERSEQHNPLHIVNEQFKTTLMGEGALGNLQMVKDDARQNHPSQLGLLDPVKTPESNKIGVTRYLAMGSQKSGNELLGLYIDPKTSKPKRLKPKEAHDMKVAFPDQFTVVRGKVKFNKKFAKVQYQGKVKLVKNEEVDLVVPSSQSMFTFATAMVPFIDSLQGNRAFMASKHTEQTTPLIDPETPLVKSSFGGEVTIEDTVGKAFSASSPASGKVEKIAGDYMIVKGNDGERHKVNLYNNFKLNEKSFFHHTPTVKEGDKIRKGGLLADLNFTKGGELSLGKNIKTAYMVGSGATIEDSIIVSESLSQKMSHQQIHEEKSPKGENWIYDKKQFGVHYPGILTNDQSDKLDDRGIIKKGQILQPGDVIFASMRKSEDTSADRILRKLGKGLVRPLKNRVTYWEKKVPGVVTGVTETSRGYKVHIKATKPLEVGDKLSGRHGNKGVVGEIRPDGEMPANKDGEHVELIFNPIGVVGRTNPSQILETVVSKVALKTGKPVLVQNFDPKSNHQIVMDLLKEHDIKPTEELFDPKTGKSFGEITVGNPYILKLVKTSESGFSARAHGEGYDLNQQPITGGEEGSKSLDLLSNWSLISHGSKDLLREMATTKSEQSDEFWRAVQLGQMLPAPKVPFAWNKFEAMLQTAGVNVEKKGSLLTITPGNDKDILAMSAGEISDPKMLRGKNLKEQKGGLFDPDLTGGVKGTKWTHLKLPEAIPNPIFEDPIKKITGINNEQFKNIVNGKHFVSRTGKIVKDPNSIANIDEAIDLFGITPDKGGYSYKDGNIVQKIKVKNSDTQEEKLQKIIDHAIDPRNKQIMSTGGPGIQKLLEKVDINKIEEEAKNAVLKSKGSERSSAHKKLRYAKALKDQKRTPQEAYMTEVIPVMPPTFRPIYQLESGDIGVAPINYLYRDLGLVSNQMKNLDQFDDEIKQPLRQSMYQGMEALVGISGARPLTRPAKGIISTIAGDSPKTGYFQSKVLRKQQDLAARGVIVPDPNLGIDEVGIPKKMAQQLFRPFVMNKMIKRYGVPAAEAYRKVNNPDGDDVVDSALNEVMKERPVILNRAPSLHKYSIQAFDAKISPGKSIRIPSIVVKGFNADFDGDQMNIHIPVSAGAVRDANRMKPSEILRSPARTGDSSVSNYLPQDMGQYGIYQMSLADGKTVRKPYASAADVRDAIENGEIDYRDKIGFNGMRVGAGNVLLNDELPEKHRDYKRIWDKKAVTELAVELTKENPKKAGHILNRFRQLGDQVSVNQTMTMRDIEPVKDPRRTKALDKMELIAQRKIDPLIKAEKMLQVLEKDLVPVIDDFGDKNSVMYEWLRAGATNKKGQVRQFISGPTMVLDHTDTPVPVPIKRSFSEGLSVSEYFTHMYGSRKGMIDRALETAAPGYQNKLILTAVGDQLISGTDCGDREGIEKPIDDSDIVDRFEVGKKKVITPELLASYKKSGMKTIKVRSPLTCKNARGICATCYGLNENGKLYEDGVNVGAIAGQSMGEPLTQGMMKSFHTGGVLWDSSAARVKRKGVSPFGRIQQLTLMPKNIANKTTLSQVDGKIEEILDAPGGGYNVTIGGKAHNVRPGLDLTIKPGSYIKKGDPLSEGSQDPSEILELKGMRPAQMYINDELHKAYGQRSLKKRNFEVVTRAATDTAVIKDPGNNSDWAVGDLVPYSVADDINRRPEVEIIAEDALGYPLTEPILGYKKGHVLKIEDMVFLSGKKVKVKRDPVKFEPMLLGVKGLPNKKGWLEGLSQEQIQRTLLEGTAMGATSNIHGNHPVPAFAYGLHFGEGPDGRY